MNQFHRGQNTIVSFQLPRRAAVPEIRRAGGLTEILFLINSQENAARCCPLFASLCLLRIGRRGNEEGNGNGLRHDSPNTRGGSVVERA